MRYSLAPQDVFRLEKLTPAEASRVLEAIAQTESLEFNRASVTELTAADQANRLMDRRVNEWLGNQCDRRYLFGLRELWLLWQQRAYLVWGSKREQKEKLLLLSRRRVLSGLAVLLAVAVGVSGFAGWLNLTTAGQIQQAKWQLAGLLNKASDVRVAESAVAFAKNGQWDKAFRLVDCHILGDQDTTVVSGGRDASLSFAISDAADILVRMRDSLLVQPKLDRLADYAHRIKYSSSKSDALSAIASTYVELGDVSRAEAVLLEALEVVKTIQDDGYKSDALSAIANSAVRLSVSNSTSLLAQVLDSAHRENASSPMVTVATLYANQSEWGKALSALSRSRESDKTQGLTQLLTIFAESQRPQLIEGPVILNVELKEQTGGYLLSVTIQSPDEDCQNHTDWWEIITPKGDLLHRQIIDTVHSESEPFVSESLITGIDPQEEIIIRAHFSGPYDEYRSGEEASGYSDQGRKGTLESEDFESIRLSKDFARQLTKVEPLPDKEACSNET